MITEYDPRVYTESKYTKEFEKAVTQAMNHIREHYMTYAEKGDLGYSHKFRPRTICNAFDEQISKKGFEIDGRTLRHAHGIGNNNKWDILDKDMVKVGEFYSNNNMYNGVYVGVSIKDKVIDRFELCSGGFIRED